MKDTLTEAETPTKDREARDYGLLIMLLLLIVGTLIFAIVAQQESQSAQSAIERVLQP